jgi:hypothetical protein
VGEPAGLGWSITSHPCFVSYPGGNGGSYPFPDFLSKSTPPSYFLEARYARGNGGDAGGGDHYIGWSSAKDGTVANFVGFRYLASLNAWACIIRANGADVTAVPFAGAPDGAAHTFKVSNGGTANSVTCALDSISRTASGQIPVSSWYAVMGVDAGPITGYATTIEARIHISGISR